MAMDNLDSKNFDIVDQYKYISVEIGQFCAYDFKPQVHKMRLLHSSVKQEQDLIHLTTGYNNLIPKFKS